MGGLKLWREEQEGREHIHVCQRRDDTPDFRDDRRYAILPKSDKTLAENTFPRRIMKKIYEFKELNKNQKKELKKDYIKREWKNLLISYFFIILSSSKPFFSSMNGAIFVLIWFTLAVLLSVYAYVTQSDYMSRKKKAERYSKKHKHAEVEKGSSFFPEIGGRNFIGMQVLAAFLVCFVAVPVSLYLQFKNLEIYKEVYVKLLIGIFADTYIVAFFNVILQILIEFIADCVNDRTILKETIFTRKHVIGYVGAAIILCIAFTYYFNKEFEGLFGDMGSQIAGSIYITFMLYPLIKCIKQVPHLYKCQKLNG